MANCIKTDETQMEIFNMSSFCCRNNKCGKSLQINLKNIEKQPFFRNSCCARKGCLLAAKLVDLYGLQLNCLKSVKLEGDKKYHYLMVDASTTTSVTIKTPTIITPYNSPNEHVFSKNSVEKTVIIDGLAPDKQDHPLIVKVAERSISDGEESEMIPIVTGTVPVRPVPEASSIKDLIKIANQVTPSEEDLQVAQLTQVNSEHEEDVIFPTKEKDYYDEEEEADKEEQEEEKREKPKRKIHHLIPDQVYKTIKDDWSDSDDEDEIDSANAASEAKRVLTQEIKKSEDDYDKTKRQQDEEQSMLLLPSQHESQSRKMVNSSVNWKMISDTSMRSLVEGDLTPSMEEAVREATEKAAIFRKGTEITRKSSNDIHPDIDLTDPNPLTLAPGESMFKSSICLEQSKTDTKCCGFLRKKKKKPKKASRSSNDSSKSMPAVETQTVPPEVINLDKPKKEAKFSEED